MDLLSRPWTRWLSYILVAFLAGYLLPLFMFTLFGLSWGGAMGDTGWVVLSLLTIIAVPLAIIIGLRKLPGHGRPWLTALAIGLSLQLTALYFLPPTHRDSDTISPHHTVLAYIDLAGDIINGDPHTDWRHLQSGTIQQDGEYRLNVLSCHVPSTDVLRERDGSVKVQLNVERECVRAGQDQYSVDVTDAPLGSDLHVIPSRGLTTMHVRRAGDLRITVTPTHTPDHVIVARSGPDLDHQWNSVTRPQGLQDDGTTRVELTIAIPERTIYFVHVED